MPWFFVTFEGENSRLLEATSFLGWKTGVINLLMSAFPINIFLPVNFQKCFTFLAFLKGEARVFQEL
jgi:hypothetical protein